MFHILNEKWVIDFKVNFINSLQYYLSTYEFIKFIKEIKHIQDKYPTTIQFSNISWNWYIFSLIKLKKSRIIKFHIIE